MNTAANVGLQVAATGLVALGVETIKGDLISGGIEIVLGIALYLVYELTPAK